MNARYALNAANARWGSLYDALYGTDAIPEDGRRGARQGLQSGARPEGHRLRARLPRRGGAARRARHGAMRRASRSSGGSSSSRSASGGDVGLADPEQLRRLSTATRAAPTAILLRNHGLHLEIRIDRDHPIGKDDPAGIADVVLEAAMTTIMDFEDSIAAVDADDKVAGLPQLARPDEGRPHGELREGRQDGRRARSTPTATIQGAGRRRRSTLHGRSLMLVRNVGHLMTSDAVLDKTAMPIPEGILDAMVTSAIALHDVGANGRRANSRAGSVYIVKPKMHGPEEVAFSDELFGRVEEALGLAALHAEDGHHGRGAAHDAEPEGIDPRREGPHLLHQHRLPRSHRRRDPHLDGSRADDPQGRHEGVDLDPGLRGFERRHRASLRAARPRADRQGHVGDAGPDGRHAEGEDRASEGRREHRVGALAHRRDAARAALSPGRREGAAGRSSKSRKRASIDDILSIPVAERPNWPREDIQKELDNNAQGILGYVVRWIDQGVGCSKVPDINNVGLMEDRATLRISSQHIANWLHHGVVTEGAGDGDAEADGGGRRPAERRRPALPADGAGLRRQLAFQAACDLVFKGREQPNGYTEPILHARRHERRRQGRVAHRTGALRAIAVGKPEDCE